MSDEDAPVPVDTGDLERWVLGGLLLNRDVVADVLERLVPAHFHNSAHRDVFRVVQDMWVRGEPVDAMTVAAELSHREQLHAVGGAAYLHLLIANVPAAADTVDYANTLVRRPK